MFYDYICHFNMFRHTIVQLAILVKLSQQTRNICITFLPCWTNVEDDEDVGPTLYKCYTIVLCLLDNKPLAKEEKPLKMFFFSITN